ncbi:hypothetical protein CDAR_444311 [Caerostris darwini]|uniref:Uncharacterized protein n=1 Tax=Caerostris darwini TaxID=1538125 RepID=A0AAV4X992_9ARAC|nr:hypothetical protein CDAR_444311 [Caerostris darwini]
MHYNCRYQWASSSFQIKQTHHSKCVVCLWKPFVETLLRPIHHHLRPTFYSPTSFIMIRIRICFVMTYSFVSQSNKDPFLCGPVHQPNEMEALLNHEPSNESCLGASTIPQGRVDLELFA